MPVDYRDAPYFWPSIYAKVHEILGDAHVMLAFGDTKRWGRVHAANGEAVAMGEVAPTDLTWTPSEALSAFDTAFDLSDPANWKGIIPMLTFNGTDEELDTADDTFYTRIGGEVSIGFLANTT